MTPTETAVLVRYIEALCPQQKIDEYTPDAWHDVLAELDFEVARYAAMRVAHRQPFISPSEIIAEANKRETRAPYERTVAEAITASSARELTAAPAGPPNPAYLAAKDQMIARMLERDEQALLYDHQAERRANAWLDYKLTGKLPPQLPLSGPPHPRWVQLPGDPPELREWLVRQSQAQGEERKP